MMPYLTTFVFLIPMVYQDLKLRAVHEGFLFALYLSSVAVSAMLYDYFGILILMGISIFAIHKKVDPEEDTLGSADVILIMCLLNLFGGQVIEVLAMSLIFAYLYTSTTGREDIPFFGCVLIGVAVHFVLKEFVLPYTAFTLIRYGK